jgi:hypothetical protein
MSRRVIGASRPAAFLVDDMEKGGPGRFVADLGRIAWRDTPEMPSPEQPAETSGARAVAGPGLRNGDRSADRVVREYLEAIESHKPRRGRRRTTESIEGRLQIVSQRIGSADPLSRVHLIQERINLEGELRHRREQDDLAELEDRFVAVAAGYARRRHLTYGAWRAAGVTPEVLRRAGIAPGAGAERGARDL